MVKLPCLQRITETCAAGSLFVVKKDNEDLEVIVVN